MNCGGLEDVRRPLKNLIQDGGVTPDFGVERGAARVKNSNHFPAAARKGDGISELQAGISFGGILAHDEFRKPGLKHAALSDSDKGTNLEDVRRDPTDLYVRIGAGANERECDHTNDILREKSAARSVTGNSRFVAQVFDGFQGDAAHHF